MLSTKHINDATAATALLDIQHCQIENKRENAMLSQRCALLVNSNTRIGVHFSNFSA